MSPRRHARSSSGNSGHKRTIPFARTAGRIVGWALGYVVAILLLYALARVGWGMLTAQWTLSFVQSIGFRVVFMVSYAACELFRTRDEKK